MSIKIERKVSHHEWDEVSLTPEQFIKFDALYFGDECVERYSLSPNFIFDNGEVYSDESWDISECGKVSTSSFQCGIMSFSDGHGQYIKQVHAREKKLGQLVSVGFTVEDGMLEILNNLD